ncbi:Predicted arabinose efflux permease, MFS family [Saccharopolyspora kobensis]|uniref:Predicted arabinose efflux permease, MFS family n=1 Tax=Saccharopolyspora kobensis TaxID=146035 RepID=A0A1H6DI23_9PSEU|nr:aromatic acid/H+ symport family MFS transporter [Saccharopolyspora kobensis]SEG84890.1 Predicted arabinose efflux permease, MFS family [Saccharopolyspora kobensis]SFD26458.1 Predicted arabinose efflux permease, MFS family [Saccharopolyspora kobensis]
MAGVGSVGRSGWVLPLCWTAVLLDGFDLVVLGSVLPVLLEVQQWGLTAASASLVSTAGLVGMTIGALAIGTITDVIGRRKALIFAVISFSLFTALCAVAPSVFAFGLLRFLAGLGLGGCLPTAIALVTEHARAGRSGSATTTIMTGYHVGAVLTALLGIAVLPNLGWRAMFVIGAAPALVLVPLMLRYLPESESFQQVKAERGAGGGAEAVASLFRGGFARATIAFWVTSFMGLLLVYGLNTWLPQIMKSAGYPLDAALGLLLTLNIGAVIGLLIAGAVADRVGPRPATIGWFAASAVFLAALSIKLPGIGVYLAVLVAGCFVFSSQVLVYAYIGRVYPAANRATGLGWSAGIGRIGAICGPLLGGAMLTAGIAYPWGFYAFAVVGALGAVGAALVRRPGVAQSPERAAERAEQ